MHRRDGEVHIENGRADVSAVESSLTLHRKGVSWTS